MAYRTEGRDIIWDGWENGVADSPYLGLGDMRNANISGTKGELSVAYKTFAQNYPKVSGGTLTLTDTGDYIANANLVEGMAFTCTTGGGLSSATVYFVKSAGGGLFNASLSRDGAVVPITSNTTVTFTTIDMGMPVSGCVERVVSSGTITAHYYMVDSNGRVWVTAHSTYGNTSYWTYMNNQTITDGSADIGKGIAAWKGYLFVFRRRYIAYCNTSLSSAPVAGDWSATWKTMNSASTSYAESHLALVGQDDVLYFCDKDYIGSIREVDGSTFDPTSSGTYVWNPTALRLPSTEIAQCLGEVGRNLLIGGIRNFVYPWDRISSSFSYPIMMPEQTTVRIVTANNLAYLFAGNRGRIYVTNGSSVDQWYSIPDNLTGASKPYFHWQDAMWHRNKVFFSFASTTNSAPGTAQTLLGGVWSVDTTTKALVCENKLSYGTYGGWASVLLSQFIRPSWGNTSITTGTSGEGYYAGWYDGVSAYGVDAFDNASQGTSVPYSSYETYVDLDMTPVGQVLTPRTFENVEFKLGRPLVSGEKVKIQYRTDLSQSFSDSQLVGECTTTDAISDLFTVSWDNVQWIQFRVLLSSTNSSPSFVRLREVRMR